MKVLIDATMVKPGQAGIRTFALNLTRNLADLDDAEVSVVVAKPNADDWGAAQVLRSSLDRQELVPRLAWRALSIPRLVREAGVDALLVPAPEPVNSPPGVAQGMIIHDLGPLIAPGIYGRRRFASYAAMIGRYVRQVDAVFTPSESTKLDIQRWLGTDIKPPIVAGPVLHYDAEGIKGSSGDAEIGRGFALYVGAMLPHKNVKSVIGAFGLDGELRARMPEKLIIVGPRYGREVEEALSFGNESVEHRGFVSSEELDQLYRDARVLVFPSLFEGFGLPMLEGLARGTCVVASDIAALREVGGQNATYVSNPTDVRAWAEALAVAQPSRSQRGTVSWKECARTVLEGLGQVCHSRADVDKPT